MTAGKRHISKELYVLILSGLSLCLSRPADAVNETNTLGNVMADGTVACTAVDDKEIVSAALETSRPLVCATDTVELLFLGDIMMHSAQIENTGRGDGSFDFSEYFSSIGSDITAADIAVANMEFTLAGEPYSGYPAFSAPDAYVGYMADMGIDIFLTANNHIIDKGKAGLVRTLEKYRSFETEKGIRVTGSAESISERNANHPLFIYAKGLRIAFLNFTYGTNSSFGQKFPGTNYMSDTEAVKDAVSRAERLDADIIIALPHWGEEYRLIHSPAQEKFAGQLAEYGVDLIVGSHPHVVQDCDTLQTADGRSVPVIYSLGNAISNMSAANTQIGLMLKIRLLKDADGNLRILGQEFVFTWCSLPGRLKDSHCTVKVADYIGRKEEWKMPYEYDKMIDTYYRVKKETGMGGN